MPNPLDRFKLWIAKRALKAAGGQLALIPGWMRHSPFFPDFKSLVREAYKGNATVFACQLILALKFPEPSLQAWKQNKRGKLEIIPNHPLRQLLAKPNADMGEDELMKFVITYCALGGNIYLWKQRNNGRKIMALWPFHDGQMTPIPGRHTEEGLVHYYVLNVGDYTPRDSNPWRLDRHDDLIGVAIPKTEIIHWKWMLDPEYPWRGIGALVASAGDVDLRNELKSFVYSLLKNDATPPFIIKLAEGEEMDEEKAKRLRAEWRQSHSGVNRGSFAILEAGMDAQQMSMNLQQLQIESLQSSPDAAICMGYHIHPAVVGALIGLQYSTYNNQKEARESLAEDTLIPLWNSFESEVQQGMADEAGYGRELVIAFDVSTVRALQANQGELETRLAHGVEIGALTRAEYRQAMGFESTPADEVRKVSFTWDWERADMMPEEREAEALGTGAEPGPAGDIAPANIESLAGLNGAQITAALAILEGLRTGTSSAVVAIELLIALGLDEERAKRIVNATPRAEGDEPIDETPQGNFPPEKRNGHHRNGKARADAPNYRLALNAKDCPGCAFARAGYCKKYDFIFNPSNVCDAWQEHEYASTQFNLDHLVPFYALILRISENDLAGDGRESQPHVTVKYGLMPDTLTAVSQVTDRTDPFVVMLGKTSLFAGEEFDVVKVDVFSEALERLHSEIEKVAPHVTTHAVYSPHLTLAYVKPGLGQRYEGWNDLEGLEYRVEEIIFSQVDGQQITLPLRGKKSHGVKAVSPQQRAKLMKQVEALRKVRTALQGKMEKSLQKYFDELAGRVESRLEAGKTLDSGNGTPAAVLNGLKVKVNNLLRKEDEAELETLLKSYTLQIGESSWGILNIILGAETEFDRNSPAMQATLARSGDHVKDILGTTKDALRGLLQYGQAQGWSIGDYVRGDETQPGIRALVEETYKHRAEAIARAELGTAQNNLGFERYKDFGVKHVIIFDNGMANSHPFCSEIDGSIVELDWYERNPLQHPNCLRAAAPVFDYTGDVETREVPFGGKFDGG